MEVTIREQRRAVSQALRDMRRELLHAKDAELSEEYAETIRGLEAAMQTLQSFEALSQILKTLVS